MSLAIIGWRYTVALAGGFIRASPLGPTYGRAQKRRREGAVEESVKFIVKGGRSRTEGETTKLVGLILTGGGRDMAVGGGVARLGTKTEQRGGRGGEEGRTGKRLDETGRVPGASRR